MAIAIPADFDFRTIPLDVNEQYIRDTLGLDIEYWAKFRHVINIGVDATNLHSLGESPITDNVKSAYRELGKSHYEVITSLGCTALSLQAARNADNLLMFQKSCKDFYFHAGCVLDNLARLIYILNDSNSANEIKDKSKIFKRHWVGWGNLKNYPGHTRVKHDTQLEGIKNIRNCLTHSWKIPFWIENQEYYWPKAVRLGEKNFLWPYDEIEFSLKYKEWVPVVNMMDSDMDILVEFQDDIFEQLIKDIELFERTNSVEIR
jgi:hypothetical protein